MANGYVDPFNTAGDLGGQGMEDLYSTYTQYGNLMGAGGMNFSIAGEQYGLETYDTTAEDRLREGFRLDYRDFSRSLSSLYADSDTTRTELSGKIGKAGFAGGGGSIMDDYQSSLSAQVRDARLGFKNKREDLMGDISDLRSDYQDDVFSTYQTYLSTDPEDLPDSGEILACYQDNKIYDSATGECVEVGELPEEWQTSFVWNELEGGDDQGGTDDGGDFTGGTTDASDDQGGLGGTTGGTVTPGGSGTGSTDYSGYWGAQGPGGATMYCPNGKIPNALGECEDIAVDPEGEGLML